jgi:hypothetical protein
MKTTYTIEFMRLAEPPLAPIKATISLSCRLYYCNLEPRLIKKPLAVTTLPTFTLFQATLRVVAGDRWREFKAVGREGP